MKPHELMNYYELLGVSEKATTDEIRLAYRDLARVYHPDSTYYDEIVAGEPPDEDRMVFQTITTAFNTLVDPVKRSFYDRTLRLESLRGRPQSTPGSRTLSLHRSMLASRSAELEIPTYEEIEGLGDQIRSVSDMIRDRQGPRILPGVVLALVAIVLVVINLIARALAA